MNVSITPVGSSEIAAFLGPGRKMHTLLSQNFSRNSQQWCQIHLSMTVIPHQALINIIFYYPVNLVRTRL